MLSDRSRLAEEPTALDRALAERRARGEPVLDLTVVDPSFAREEEAVRAALASEGSADPRAAIAGALARGGVSLAPEAIVPCSGPEDAWARLLWLLADPGDRAARPAARGAAPRARGARPRRHARALPAPQRRVDRRSRGDLGRDRRAHARDRGGEPACPRAATSRPRRSRRSRRSRCR
ncbi:MAG: hypothetical protein M5U28_27835 [Sandaracinaceae bacterium]|nr:hypothetical protein [Sandaracinaceae bacterium]